jgi:hypothetical protein
MANEEPIEDVETDTVDTGTDDAAQDDSADDVDSSDEGADDSSGDDSSDGDSDSSDSDSPEGVATKQKDEASEIAGIIERTLKSTEEKQRQQQEAALEKERIALMTPEQKEAYNLKKEIENLKRDQLVTKIQNAENMDKMAIKADAKLSPLYKKYENKVEEKIKEIRAQGQWHNRESVLYYILGQEVAGSYKSGSPSRQKAKAEENIRKATASATKGKGSVKLNGSRDPNSASARAERLSNIRL